MVEKSHFRRYRRVSFSWQGAGLVLALCSVCSGLLAAEVADTRILKWKDGKEAVFLLSFDDSCPSHLQSVIPELEKRGMVGNFYINPGKGTYLGRRAEWEKAAKSPAVSIANHTFTHVGAESVAQLDDELLKCNEVIHSLLPERKWPRLIAFGMPGGVPWTISQDEMKVALAKQHLIDRPNFQGPPIHEKSVVECIATIDQALAKNGMGHLDMHGVGGDWLVTPMDWFTAILDKLEAEKPRVWVTDLISYHQYQTERETAAVELIKSGPLAITLTLGSSADPDFYDLPLTLETTVPADWRQCTIQQGSIETTVTAKDGVIRYSGIPGKEEIRLLAK